MNRRGFFKGIGAVTAATIITPTVLLEEVPVVPEVPMGNEGLWTQIRRAKTIAYDRPNGLTRDDIKNAVEAVFRDYPKPERFANFRTGKLGEQEIRRQMHAYILNGITYTT